MRIRTSRARKKIPMPRAHLFMIHLALSFHSIVVQFRGMKQRLPADRIRSIGGRGYFRRVRSEKVSSGSWVLILTLVTSTNVFREERALKISELFQTKLWSICCQSIHWVLIRVPSGEKESTLRIVPSFFETKVMVLL